MFSRPTDFISLTSKLNVLTQGDLYLMERLRRHTNIFPKLHKLLFKT